MALQQQSELYNTLKCLRGHLIVLEGTISAGKTTLGQNIVDLLSQSDLPVKFFQEYVNESLLQQYISNMGKYSYSFQLIMQSHRIHNYKLARQFSNQGGIAIVDRSIIGDYAFALMQKNKGFITEQEWLIYNDIFVQENIIQPDGIIYLACSSNIVIHRISQRGIKCESAYDETYLLELEEAYKIAFEANKITCLTIDWNKDRSNKKGSEKALKILKSYIRHFIVPLLAS